jgi:tetratricopeptide (TPR) repeat protein
VAALLLLLAVAAVLLWLHPGTIFQKPAEAKMADLWQQAHQEIADGEFRAAVIHLEQCLDSCPFHAETQFLLARTCRRAKELAGWQKHLARAELLQWPRAQIDLERRLERAQSGDLGKVAARLEAALETPSPEDVVVFEALARGYLENDWVERALNLANLWLERHPDDWEARYYRGLALQRKPPKTKEAIADLKRALELKPGQSDVLWALADLYMGNDKLEEALPLYESYLESDPANTDALFQLANCQLTSLGEPDKARLTLNKLLAIEPNHVMALYLQAKVELADGLPEKALEWLRRAERLAPHDPYIVQNLMAVLHDLKRTEEADKYQKLAGEIGQWEGQLIQAKMECRNQPDNAMPRYQAGMLSLKLGQESEAATWFQRALWIEPDHPPTHAALADYWEKHSNPQRADYHRKKAGGKAAGASSP